jgi:hypothetical protein
MSKEYLETLHHFEKINWNRLSENPAIFDEILE